MAMSALASALEGEPAAAATTAPAGSIAAYFELAKGRLVLAILAVVGATFLAAGGEPGWRLAAALVGTGATAGAAGALNQWWEARWDALMDRTRGRPIPSGRIAARTALVFAAGLFSAGAVTLWLGCGPAPALLAIVSAAVYVLAYTPLKRRTPLSLVPGAVSGALPVLIGAAAAAADPSPQVALLFVVLLAWQVPHTLAIDWRYREDYARGGYRTLSRIDPSGRATGRVALIGAALTGAASVGGLAWLGAGPGALLGALLVAVWLLAAAGALWRVAGDEQARRLFRVTVLALPAVLVVHLVPGLGS